MISSIVNTRMTRIKLISTQTHESRNKKEIIYQVLMYDNFNYLIKILQDEWNIKRLVKDN